VHRFGLGVAALYAIHRALQVLSRGRAKVVPYGLFAQPLGGGEPATPLRADASTRICKVGPGDELAQALPRPADVLQQRWAHGSECRAAVVKGQFAGCVWFSRGQHHEDEVRCTYVLEDPRRSVWDFDVYVEPAFRLSRTLARLWRAVDEELAAEGVRWSFSRISLFNRPSIAAHERLGAQRVGLACFLVMGPLQLTCQSHAPYLQVHAGNAGAPSIRLRQPGLPPRDPAVRKDRDPA
jgi:hypothetical protein